MHVPLRSVETPVSEVLLQRSQIDAPLSERERPWGLALKYCGGCETPGPPHKATSRSLKLRLILSLLVGNLDSSHSKEKLTLQVNTSTVAIPPPLKNTVITTWLQKF